MATAITNPSFEEPAASGVPGEALGWTWASIQAGGAWAEFNASVLAFIAWQRAREDFEAAYGVPWSWSYADAVARTAAGGFAAADVGHFAVQRDDDSLWLLLAHSPPAWFGLGAARNNDAIADLAAVITAAALFDGGSPTHAATIELWTIVFDYWLDLAGWHYAGPTWYLDAPLLRVDDPSFTDPAERGWRGWADGPALTATWPLAEESFEEYWGSDPFYTGSPWESGTAAGGALRGRALTWPVVMPPNQALFGVWNHTTNDVTVFEVAPGTYADAAALAQAVQDAWDLAWPYFNMVEWGAWIDGAQSGVQLAWNGNLGAAHLVLCVPRSRRSEDARARLGLDALGPNGATGAVQLPASLLSGLPGGYLPSEVFLADPWAQIVFVTEWDAAHGGWFPVEADMMGAIFDTVIAAPTYTETYILTAWFGLTAVWRTSLAPGDLTAAVFSGAVAGKESFENPGTNWPDHIYVDP